jgi:electron transfer flavoprotein alpha subunit
MATILVYVETRGGAVLPISFELLAAARALAATSGGTVEALVCAADPAAPAAELGNVDRVLTVAHPTLSPYLPEAHAAVLEAVVTERQPDVVLFGYTSAGLDLGPAVAGRCSRSLAAYCKTLTLEGDTLTAQSQGFGGKLVAEVSAPLPAGACVMPGAYDEAAGRGSGTPETVVLAPPSALATLRTRVLEEIQPEASGVDLTQSDKILCVGRGIGEAAKIPLAQEVANLIGAELAGSRPIIDNGWLEKARQVGKSGTKVKPKLYVAVGVSGAPEHLEGMMRADLIVAINKDAQAPIFGVAHYGATVDLFDLLPKLAERLRAG